MIRELICYLNKHKWKDVANFGGKSTGDRRALWQCSCCKTVVMEMPTEFYDKRERKTPTI